MIKFICFASFPVLAAVFCAQHAPDSKPPGSVTVESADRHFLAALNREEAARAERVAQADREFLVRQHTNDSIPVAIAVRPAIAMRTAQPVRVEEAVPVATAVRVRSAQQEPEVRRAIPVAPRRASIVISRGEVVRMSAVTAQ